LAIDNPTPNNGDSKRENVRPHLERAATSIKVDYHSIDSNSYPARGLGRSATVAGGTNTSNPFNQHQGYIDYSLPAYDMGTNPSFQSIHYQSYQLPNSVHQSFPTQPIYANDPQYQQSNPSQYPNNASYQPIPNYCSPQPFYGAPVTLNSRSSLPSEKGSDRSSSPEQFNPLLPLTFQRDCQPPK
jgi:hypothetical protein